MQWATDEKYNPFGIVGFSNTFHRIELPNENNLTSQ